MTASTPRFLDAGDSALVVEYGTNVDVAVHARVLELDNALTTMRPAGVLETVPTYRSLMIHFDPLLLLRQDLIAIVKRLVSTAAAVVGVTRFWTIPCCYEAEYGEDIGYIADLTGLTAQRVVELHSRTTYRVYMYGFAPGFCYLGGLPEELAISRRQKPRPPHPANTILVGGGLTLISTFSMPTGWFLVGRTPERMFAPARDPVFLVSAGDSLCFEQIDRATLIALDERAAAGEIVASWWPSA